MKINEEKELVIIATAGSVDDGKSTLVGRLLYDCDYLFEDQLESLRKMSGTNEINKEDLALITDGLSSEREQKITIDVAYRHFSRPNRKFIIADVPGHEQYTRNMVTGASKADLVVIIVDAKKGISPQSKRHLLISSLLGINHVVIVVNKMDLINFDEEQFEKIKKDFSNYASKTGVSDLQFIPISALDGDMVVNRKENMPWYNGPTLLSYLENVQIISERNLIDFRFPVQLVIRPNQNFRGYAGKIESGTIKKGEEIMILPSYKKTKIKSIILGNKKVSEACAGQSIVLEFTEEIDASRGDLILRVNNVPFIGNQIDTMINWFSETKLDFEKEYLIKHTTKTVRGVFARPTYIMNVHNLHREKNKTVKINDIARISLKTNINLFFDEYKKIKATGSFIIIDEITNDTVGAGVILNKDKKDIQIDEKEKSITLKIKGFSKKEHDQISKQISQMFKGKKIKFEVLD